MFDIFKSFKKMVGLGNQPENKAISTPLGESSLETKTDKLVSFFSKISDLFLAEYDSIKEKSKDLSTTNYELGMKHLENGNIKEAIFRFKITKKFWPENYQAHYQLISCLLLNRNFEEAKKAIDELLEKKPDYKEAIDRIVGDIPIQPKS